MNPPTPPDLSELYADHDILVFPTIWEEPFGLVPLETMASGCLVVATGTGGSGEFLRHRETAMLFRPEYPLGLAECVLDWSRIASWPMRSGRLVMKPR